MGLLAVDELGLVEVDDGLVEEVELGDIVDEVASVVVLARSFDALVPFVLLVDATGEE